MTTGLASTLLPWLGTAASAPHSQGLIWTNARWLENGRFRSGDRYSLGRVFVAQAPAGASVIDLRGRYVLPALGDAHHHGIDGPAGLDAKIEAFTQDGIFFVKNPNVIPDLLSPELRSRLARHDGLDVAFSNGGLTSSGGHPVPLHQRLAAAGVFPGLTAADMPNRAYFALDTVEDLERQWPLILGGAPDFLKTFLLFTEDEPFMPVKRAGLRPEVLQAVVSKAHGSGLRVTTHVQTAADFRLAVQSGVDEINHIPTVGLAYAAHRERYLLDARTVDVAAAKGVVVISTTDVFFRFARMAGPDAQALIRSSLGENLALLKRAGVRLAIGSDGISGERPFVTARNEARRLVDEGWMSATELVHAWAVETPKAIYPYRALGSLSTQHEASFIVLDRNPLESFDAFESIQLRVRNGLPLAQAVA